MFRAAHIVLFASGAIATATLGACTLIARFDDEPADDAGTDATALDDVAPPGDDDGSSPGTDASSDAKAKDARADVGEVDAGLATACVGRANGSYCGNDGLNGFTGPSSDLVRCDGGTVAIVVPCDAGCLALSNPFPDTCNGCNNKANGSYCGRDIPVFPTTDGDWLVQCQNGNAVQLVACSAGCGSNGASSKCN